MNNKSVDKTEEVFSLGYVIKTNIENFFTKVEEFAFFCFCKDWWIIEFLMLFQYMFNSPYKIMKKHHSNEDDFVYGEISVRTICKILKDIEANRDDVFIDLGSGRGYAVFGAYLSGIKHSIGIELVKEFIDRALKIKSALKTDKIDFLNDDFTKLDLNSATIIFIAGTTMEETTIKKIACRISEIDHCVKIVSLSRQLKGKKIKTVFSKEYRFSWGNALVYYQIKE
ncbi:hypothetical protein IJJ97_03395 [bacterium]|nr:hypothetical protein [bacterium]